MLPSAPRIRRTGDGFGGTDADGTSVECADADSRALPRRVAECGLRPLGHMIKGTFAERYCAMHGLADGEFTEVVLRRSLYPQARLLRLFLRLKPGYFKADREFVSSVGRIKRMRDFDLEAFAYANDPDNHGFLRRVLRLRVSAGRLNGIVWSTLRDGSSQPFKLGA